MRLAMPAFRAPSVKLWRRRAVVVGMLLAFLPHSLKADGNLRRVGSLSLAQDSADYRGFYAAAIGPPTASPISDPNSLTR